MCFGTPTQDAPAPPPVAPEAPTMPDTTMSDAATGGSAAADKRRRAAAVGQGAQSTILTGSRGVTQPGATTIKTLLGQ